MSESDEEVSGIAALQLLENRQAKVIPYAARVRLLAERLGQNFDATIQTFDVLPLAQNGEAHKVVRAEGAHFLGSSRTRLKRELPVLVARHFGLLKSSEALDMMEKIIVPFVDECLSVISEAEVYFDADSMASRVFSQS